MFYTIPTGGKKSPFVYTNDAIAKIYITTMNKYKGYDTLTKAYKFIDRVLSSMYLHKIITAVEYNGLCRINENWFDGTTTTLLNERG